MTDRKAEKAADKPKDAAPVIVKPLTPTVCKVGDSVRMEAVITGTPTPKVKWQHNGKQITAGDKVKIQEKDGSIHTLIMATVGTENDGEYTVRAENAAGTAQTSANLCVQGETIEFVKKLTDVEVKEGNTIDLSVELASENANIVWHKDGQALDVSGDAGYEIRVEAGGRKHSLVIKNATVHHEGEYIASVGEQECSCEVTVVELAPQFVKKLADAKVTAGGSVAFDIELSKGDAKTKWFRNGAEIDVSSSQKRVSLKIDGKKQILEIREAELSDAGEYSCTIASNSCSAKLDVEEAKVSFVEKLEPTSYGDMGKNIELKVSLDKESVEVTWMK